MTCLRPTSLPQPHASSFGQRHASRFDSSAEHSVADWRSPQIVSAYFFAHSHTSAFPFSYRKPQGVAQSSYDRHGRFPAVVRTTNRTISAHDRPHETDTELSVDEHATTIENVNVMNIEMLREANDVDDSNDMAASFTLPILIMFIALFC